jgi:hypothetical protein
LFRGARKKRRSIVEQSENYTLGLRARGVPKQCISFFLLIIGFKGLEYSITLYLGTHMRIFFEHLE